MRTVVRPAVAVFVLVAAAPVPARAQDTATFLATAREATARFRDRAVAAGEGYRAIGPDFPSMGEHWVNIALVAEGAFDPARPQILEYASFGGRPVLVGVAWALPVGNGRALPAFPPDGHAWHYHGGTVDDESFVASHGDPGHHPPGRATLAILHAWLWADNPDGMFATDNWALPWHRLGLRPPAGAPVEAAKLLSLAAGGTRYFTLLAQAVARPDSLDPGPVGVALSQAGSEAVELAAAMRARGGATRADSEELAARWRVLWASIGARVEPTMGARLAGLGR